MVLTDTWPTSGFFLEQCEESHRELQKNSFHLLVPRLTPSLLVWEIELFQSSSLNLGTNLYQKPINLPVYPFFNAPQKLLSIQSLSMAKKTCPLLSSPLFFFLCSLVSFLFIFCPKQRTRPLEGYRVTKTLHKNYYHYVCPGKICNCEEVKADEASLNIIHTLNFGLFFFFSSTTNGYITEIIQGFYIKKF